MRSRRLNGQDSVSIPAINLIPMQRRQARRLRGHARRCALLTGAFVVAVLAAAISFRAIWGGDDSTIDHQLATSNSEVERAGAEFHELDQRLCQYRATQAAIETLRAQPDWSLLLALVGRQTGSEVALRSCSVRPQQASGPTVKGAAVTPTGLELCLSGIGKSDIAVSQFVLRLEQTKLFSKVKLIDSTRQPFQSQQVFSFRIECPLETKPCGQSQGASQTFARDE